MTFRHLHAVIAVVGIGVAGGAAYWYQNNKSTDGVQGGAAAAAPGKPGAGGGAGPGGGGPVAVEVGRVEAMAIEDDAQAVGSVRARRSVMLKPEVSGRVRQIGFTDGRRVKQGQLLVQLDDTLQQAQFQQAQAQASIARTNLQRSRELAAQNFVSQSAVDQNAANLDVALAQVALAQAQLQRMRIVAPFDAVAGIRQVNVGDYVKDGADIVQLEDLTSVWVDFRLPERFIARVKAGQPVDVQFDALPGRRFDGKVEALDSLVDANGRSLLVRARLDNPGGELKSGMFARTRLVLATRGNALVVPEEALVPQGGKQFLIKLVDGEGGKVTQRIEAKLGMRVPGKVEILEGVTAGETVVTAGQSRVMRDGTKVRIVDISAPASGPSPASAPRAGAAV